jgi:peptidoglycan/LPS O-acetylase OafA/YrhL
MEGNYNAIDIAKFVMALLVVAIHTHPENEIENKLILDIINCIYSIAVPFFFVASGFFLYNKLKTQDYENQLIYTRGWINRIARLYILWTIIYLPYAIIGFNKDSITLIKCIIVYLRNVLLVGENYLSWPLWYLLAMIVVGCIYYVFIKFRINWKTTVLVAIFLAIGGIILENEGGGIYFTLFKTTKNGLFVGFPYMVLVFSIARYGIIKSKLLILFIILCFGVMSYFGISIAGYGLAYAFFSFVLNIELHDKADDRYLKARTISLVVYLVHMIWVGMIVLLYPGLPSYWVFIITVVLSLIAAFFIVNNKKSRIVKLCFR